MQSSSAKHIVLISLIGTGAIVVVSHARKGETPPPATFLGLGAVFIAVSALADAQPGLAASFAGLVVTGTALQEGTGAFDSLLSAVEGKTGIGGGAKTQAIPAFTSAAAAASGANIDGTTHPIAARAVQFARRQIGQPYVWGGESRAEGGFDCSGLCQAAYRFAGKSIPRTSQQQRAAGYPAVKWGEFVPGDLIFSNFSGGTDATHVVMYAGGGECIAASRPGTLIHTQPLSVFQPVFLGASRPCPFKRNAHVGHELVSGGSVG